MDLNNLPPSGNLHIEQLHAAFTAPIKLQTTVVSVPDDGPMPVLFMQISDNEGLAAFDGGGLAKFMADLIAMYERCASAAENFATLEAIEREVINDN